VAVVMVMVVVGEKEVVVVETLLKAKWLKLI
jgi:hypothetical protein